MQTGASRDGSGERVLSMATTTRFVAGLGELAERYDVIFSDVWGVIHNGRVHFPQAAAALQRFRQRGGVVVLITNAPRPRRFIEEQLARLAVPRASYDGLVSSGDVTLSLMADYKATPVHHIGPPRDRALFDVLANEFGLAPPRVALAEAGYVVVTGLNDDGHEAPADYDAAFAAMRRRHLVMICANPDIVVHSGDTLLYCAGALARRFEQQGGSVAYAGKPHSAIYDRALAVAQHYCPRPIERQRVLAIGDAFHTDISGAAGQGLDALLITKGIHRDHLHSRDGVFDNTAYEQLVCEWIHRPVAAIDQLAW
jgi:HAD superfamily hydrolase (TIGR01459 family)